MKPLTRKPPDLYNWRKLSRYLLEMFRCTWNKCR